MSTRIQRFAITLGILGVIVAGEVAAHHGWSGYDSAKTLTLTGVIEAAGYEHPHASLRLATPDKNWLVVLAPPSRMENRGLSRSMLQEGTPVTVVGYPHRSAPDEMRAERMTINGTTVELR